MHEKVNFDRIIIPFYFLILELFGWKYFKSNWQLKEIWYLKLNKIQVGKYFAVFNFSMIRRSTINCSHVCTYYMKWKALGLNRSLSTTKRNEPPYTCMYLYVCLSIFVHLIWCNFFLMVIFIPLNIVFICNFRIGRRNVLDDDYQKN